MLTYIGMWIGFLGVMLAIKDRYVGSLICLMLAAVSAICLTAPLHPQRRIITGDERTFGIQIDSLSDIICFGVLPAVWVFLRDSKDISCIYRHICIHSLRAYPSGIL